MESGELEDHEVCAQDDGFLASWPWPALCFHRHSGFVPSDRVWGAWLVSRLDEPSDPSPVTLRLVRTPQPDTLSPRERADLPFTFVFIDIPASFR